MFNRLLYTLRSGKNNKFLYYARAYCRKYLFPDAWCRRRRRSELAQIAARPDRAVPVRTGETGIQNYFLEPFPVFPPVISDKRIVSFPFPEFHGMMIPTANILKYSGFYVKDIARKSPFP